MNTAPLLLFVHVLGATLWVGGMFFAYQCLRPVAAQQLAPPERQRLWLAVLARFFAWVWAIVVLVPASGLTMMAAVGMGLAPLHWQLMMASGLLMIAVFLAAYLLPYRGLRRAVAGQDWSAGGKALGWLRRLVGANLALGVLTIALATAGRLIA